MMRRGGDVARAAAAAALAIVVAAGPALADLVVSQQSGTRYRPAERLPDTAEIDVPAGGSLTLVKEPDGSTHILKGPYKGRLGGYVERAECPWYMPGCKRKDGESPGGVGGTRGATEGGTRSPAPR